MLYTDDTKVYCRIHNYRSVLSHGILNYRYSCIETKLFLFIYFRYSYIESRLFLLIFYLCSLKSVVNKRCMHMNAQAHRH